MCTSFYLNKWETLDVCRNYYSSLRRDNEESPLVVRAMDHLFSLLSEICDHPNKLMEIFGCYRNFGHPTVDELEGIRSLKENSRESIGMDDRMLRVVNGAFDRMFDREFIKINRRWPNCEVRDNTCSESMKKLTISIPLAFSEYSDVSLEDWSDLKFSPEFQFDEFNDFTELLSNTAISPYRENWYHVFNQELINIKKEAHLSESRRVLVEMLRRKDVSCEHNRKTIPSGKEPSVNTSLLNKNSINPDSRRRK